MGDSERGEQATDKKPAEQKQAPPGVNPMSAPAWQRDIVERLAQGSAKDIGTYIADNLPGSQRPAVFDFLQKQKGNGYVQQVIAATSAVEQSQNGFAGPMFVSNDPEGISKPGTVVSANAGPGKLAAYVHHSSHLTSSELELFLVVKPDAGAKQPMHFGMTGVGAAQNNLNGQLAHGPGQSSDTQWATDPNAIVAVTTQAKATAGEHDGKSADKNLSNLVNSSAEISGAKTIALGTLPKSHPVKDPTTGKETMFQPLFDGRYELDLAGPATLEIVAEATGKDKDGTTPAQRAADEKTPAIGNTKYQQPGSHGRPAGIYNGATYRSDVTALASKLPYTQILTGGEQKKESPAALQPQSTLPFTPEQRKAATALLDTSVDAAAVYVLEHVFRIAPDWLREVGVLKGDKLDPTKFVKDAWDYAALVGELQHALAADKQAVDAAKAKAKADDAATRPPIAAKPHELPELAATEKMIAAHPSVGASFDAASYGTMYSVAVLVDNDTDEPVSIALELLTQPGLVDAQAKARAERAAVAAANQGQPKDKQTPLPGVPAAAPYRGMVAVDGESHPIASDGHNGYPALASLGDATIEPGKSKYVHIEFESPGQITTGQQLRISKKS